MLHLHVPLLPQYWLQQSVFSVAVVQVAVPVTPQAATVPPLEPPDEALAELSLPPVEPPELAEALLLAEALPPVEPPVEPPEVPPPCTTQLASSLTQAPPTQE